MLKVKFVVIGLLITFLMLPVAFAKEYTVEELVEKGKQQFDNEIPKCIDEKRFQFSSYPIVYTLGSIGEYQDSTKYVEKIVTCYEKLGEYGRVGEEYRLAGHASGEIGKYDDEERYFKKALEYFEREGKPSDGKAVVSELLSYKGLISSDDALKHNKEYKKLLELNNEKEGYTPCVKYSALVRASSSIASLLYNGGKLEESNEELRQAVDYYELVKAAARQGESLCTNRIIGSVLYLGIAHKKMGRYDEVNRYYDEALEWHEKSSEKDYGGIAFVLIHKGKLNDVEKNYRLASESFLDAAEYHIKREDWFYAAYYLLIAKEYDKQAKLIVVLSNIITTTKNNVESEGLTTKETIIDEIKQDENQIKNLDIAPTDETLDLMMKFPGSDIDTILYDPKGNEVKPGENVYYSGKKSNPEIWIVNDPVPGRWALKLIGVDIPKEGEPYVVVVGVGDKPIALANKKTSEAKELGQKDVPSISQSALFAWSIIIAVIILTGLMIKKRS